MSRRESWRKEGSKEGKEDLFSREEKTRSPSCDPIFSQSPSLILPIPFLLHSPSVPSPLQILSPSFSYFLYFFFFFLSVFLSINFCYILLHALPFSFASLFPLLSFSFVYLFIPFSFYSLMCFLFIAALRSFPYFLFPYIVIFFPCLSASLSFFDLFSLLFLSLFIHVFPLLFSLLYPASRC